MAEVIDKIITSVPTAKVIILSYGISSLVALPLLSMLSPSLVLAIICINGVACMDFQLSQSLR